MKRRGLGSWRDGEVDEFGIVPRYARCMCIAPECRHPPRGCHGESVRFSAICRPCGWVIIRRYEAMAREEFGNGVG